MSRERCENDPPTGPSNGGSVTRPCSGSRQVVHTNIVETLPILPGEADLILQHLNETLASLLEGEPETTRK